MSQISVRGVDANFDPLQGNGSGSFITDLQAVALIIKTALLLFQGELWINLAAGVPLFQSGLGQSGSARQQQVFSLLLQQTILAVPFVTGVSNVVVIFNPATRAYTFSCSVSTAFGTLTVTNTPGQNASVI
jgi:hypothetical protein